MKLMLCSALLLPVPLLAAIGQPVKVDGGLVAGVPGSRDASISVFKGIPFAAPPVGAGRWRTPGPVTAWDGVRKADQFGASCIQRIVDVLKPWTYEFMTHNEISEDHCCPRQSRQACDDVVRMRVAPMPVAVRG